MKIIGNHVISFLEITEYSSVFIWLIRARLSCKTKRQGPMHNIVNL